MLTLQFALGSPKSVMSSRVLGYRSLLSVGLLPPQMDRSAKQLETQLMRHSIQKGSTIGINRILPGELNRWGDLKRAAQCYAPTVLSHLSGGVKDASFGRLHILRVHPQRNQGRGHPGTQKRTLHLGSDLRSADGMIQ